MHSQSKSQQVILWILTDILIQSLYEKRKAWLLHVQHVLRLLPHTNHVYVKTGISQARMRTVVFY